MRILVALGGNALLERGDKPDAAIQRRHVRRAARAVAPLAREHELIVCHGNGPQVGLLALQSEADAALSRPYPLDVLGAQTQGMIGYWLVQELRNAGVTQPVVCLVTQVVVAAADLATSAPTKFIGPVYSEHRAHHLARERGWTVAQDGKMWRRVVPSPQPQRVLELPAVRRLLETRAVVICGGGGGVPVIEEDSGELVGVEAVIDKDATAAAIALAIAADRMLLLTDVPAVMRDFGTPDAVPIPSLTLAELADMSFPAGSMGPKIAACRRFTEESGNPSAVGALEDAVAVLTGTAGTTITVPS